MTQGDNTIIPTSDLAQVGNHKEATEPQTSLQFAYSLSKLRHETQQLELTFSPLQLITTAERGAVHH